VLVALTWTVLLLGMIGLSVTLGCQCGGLSNHPIVRLVTVAAAAFLFGSSSVFRTVNTPFFPTMRLRGMKEPVVLLTNLHDRALYKYGAPFDDLPEEQQQELLRSYRVGSYYFAASQSKAPEHFGRRETGASGKAMDSVLKGIMILCLFEAARYALRSAPLHPMDVAMDFLMFGVVAAFAPQSSALWSEPDRPSEDRAPLERTSMPEQTSS
jgi:hypothetical protein